MVRLRRTRSKTRSRARVASRHRVLTLVALTVGAFVCLTAQSFADTATLTVTNGQGNADPTALLPRVFTVSGATTQSGVQAYVKYRATGGAGCAPSAATDTGTILDGAQGPFYGGAPTDNGAFSESDVITWPQAQTLMFCIWIAATPTTATTPFTQIVTFRPPTGTIGATISPATPLTGQPVTITISGASEAPETVYATLRAAGGSCAPTFASDTGSNLIAGSGQAVNGSYSITETASEATAGSYQVCLWLASSPTDSSPIAGPVPVSFTVAAPPPVPPPPCVVPNPAPNTSLAFVEQALLAAHCSVGAVSRIASPLTGVGDVISLNPARNSQQANGTAVSIVVSTGPACVVPRIAAGSTLAAAERGVRKAHCAVGKITRVRSRRVRRGRIVRASPAAGTIAATNAPVALVVSSGKAR